jgi:hypothetical protein
MVLLFAGGFSGRFRLASVAQAHLPLWIASNQLKMIPEAAVNSSAVPFPLQVGVAPYFFVEVRPVCNRCATGVQAPKTPTLILHSSVSLRLGGEICFSLLPFPDPCFSDPSFLSTSILGCAARKLVKRSREDVHDLRAIGHLSCPAGMSNANIMAKAAGILQRSLYRLAISISA